jgi:hypothetical protein
VLLPSWETRAALVGAPALSLSLSRKKQKGADVRVQKPKLHACQGDTTHTHPTIAATGQTQVNEHSKQCVLREKIAKKTQPFLEFAIFPLKS